MTTKNELTLLQNFANNFEDLKVKLFFKIKKNKYINDNNKNYFFYHIYYNGFGLFLLAVLNNQVVL